MNKLITLFLCFSMYAGISNAQFTWAHTDGPFGSGSSHIYSNNQYAFIPEEDFLFRSADGITWEKIEHPVSFIMHIYQDTLLNILYNKNADTLWLQLSYDNGNTWILKDLPEGFGIGMDIVMTSYGIYLSQIADDLLYRSTNLGETWEIVSVPQEFHTLEAHENRLYIHGSSKMWRTDSQGMNWEDVTPPLPASYYVDDIIAKDSHLLVTSEKHLFHSHDHGQTWETHLINSRNANNKLTLVGDQVYFSATQHLLRSNDFGVSWDTLAMTALSSMLTATGFHGIYLSTVSNKGVFRWDEAEEALIESNDGFSKGGVYDLAVGDDKIWAACGNGVFVYDVPTETWSEKMNLPLPDFEYDFISANDHGWVLVSEVIGSEFYLSENNGFTWHTIPAPEAIGIYLIQKTQLVGENIYLVSDYFLYRSTDMGLSWEYVDVGFINTEIVTANGTLYMAGTDSLYSSTDNGANWAAIHPPISINQLFVFADLLYALGYNQDYEDVLYTSADGVEWTYASDGFPTDYYAHPTYGVTNDFFFRDAADHYAFLGWHGHYTASDASMQWSPMSTSQAGSSYAIHEGVVYLGTEGMYKSIIENPYITAVDDITENPITPFTISPNPAHDLITITTDDTFNFRSPIRIYSSDGTLMKSTVTSPDAHQIDINISDLPDGIYFVSLQGENGRAVNSFVKVK